MRSIIGSRIATQFALVAILSQLVACGVKDSGKSKQEEDVIHSYGDYTAMFNEEKGRLDFVALFRVGGPTGSKLALTETSYVSVNGHTMQKVDSAVAGYDVDGTYYQVNMPAAKPAESYHVAWRRPDQVGIGHDVQIPSRLEIQPWNDSTKMDTSKDFTVNVTGEIEPDDEVSIYLATTAAKGSGPIEEGDRTFVGLGGSAKGHAPVTLSARLLQESHARRGFLYVKHTRVEIIPSGHGYSDMKVTSSYISRPISVTLE